MNNKFWLPPKFLFIHYLILNVEFIKLTHIAQKVLSVAWFAKGCDLLSGNYLENKDTKAVHICFDRKFSMHCILRRHVTTVKRTNPYEVWTTWISIKRKCLAVNIWEAIKNNSCYAHIHAGILILSIKMLYLLTDCFLFSKPN